MYVTHTKHTHTACLSCLVSPSTQPTKRNGLHTCDVNRFTTSGSSAGTAATAGLPPTADAAPPRPPAARPPATPPNPTAVLDLCPEADAFADGAEDLGASTPHPNPFPATGGPAASPPAPRPRRMLTRSRSPPLTRLDISLCCRARYSRKCSGTRCVVRDSQGLRRSLISTGSSTTWPRVCDTGSCSSRDLLSVTLSVCRRDAAIGRQSVGAAIHGVFQEGGVWSACLLYPPPQHCTTTKPKPFALLLKEVSKANIA